MDKSDWKYYVNYINGRSYCLLLGPFATHREALGYKESVRRKTQELHERAWFYAFGTCRAQDDRPGALNQFITELEFVPPTDAEVREAEAQSWTPRKMGKEATDASKTQP